MESLSSGPESREDSFARTAGHATPAHLVWRVVSPETALAADPDWRPRNLLLGGMRRHELSQLEPFLHRVQLEPGQMLAERGAPVDVVHFPETAVALLRVADAPGRPAADILPVGNDGIAGLSAALGLARSQEELVVRIPGQAIALPAAVLRRAVAELPTLRQMLDRHMHELLLRLARATLCSRSHMVQGRLATLLLELAARAGTETLPLTHEQLATMLDVRRAGVTEAVAGLREQGALAPGRGRLAIWNRPALLAAACPCAGEHETHVAPSRRGEG